MTSDGKKNSGSLDDILDIREECVHDRKTEEQSNASEDDVNEIISEYYFISSSLYNMYFS